MDAASDSSSRRDGNGHRGRRPPRPPQPLEVGALDGSSGRRALVGRSIETLAGGSGMVLPGNLASTPIHATLKGKGRDGYGGIRCVCVGGWCGSLTPRLPCSPLNPTKLHMYTVHTASLGSEFGVLPSGGGSALLPDEEEEEVDVDAVGGSRAGEDAWTGERGRDGNDNEDEDDEEELAPLHELRDVEAALGDGGFPPPEEDSDGEDYSDFLAVFTS